MWQFYPCINRFRALAGERTLDIEPPTHECGSWALWFRREAPPHRSLLVGKFKDLAQAKLAGEDLLLRLNPENVGVSAS